ncbi:protein of unknown function [Candidatus Methylomirabilis oxygeniifera]|uniref:Uncharacterized protein n=1 Tax=Methylomirabilis oxygeniifera TaxID=671143 RepID=D5MIB6_METO1|nr:protein of unknown function [Candidatus Methylomirabilis oxyfera]
MVAIPEAVREGNRMGSNLSQKILFVKSPRIPPLLKGGWGVLYAVVPGPDFHGDGG